MYYRRDAVFLLLLLVHVPPFTMLLAWMLAFFLQIGIRTDTVRYNAVNTVSEDDMCCLSTRHISKSVFTYNLSFWVFIANTEFVD